MRETKAEFYINNLIDRIYRLLLISRAIIIRRDVHGKPYENSISRDRDNENPTENYIFVVSIAARWHASVTDPIENCTNRRRKAQIFYDGASAYNFRGSITIEIHRTFVCCSRCISPCLPDGVCEILIQYRFNPSLVLCYNTRYYYYIYIYLYL